MSELIALTEAEVEMVSGGANDPTRTVNIVAVIQSATSVAAAQGGNGGFALSIGGTATANGGAATATSVAANVAF